MATQPFLFVPAVRTGAFVWPCVGRLGCVVMGGEEADSPEGNDRKKGKDKGKSQG